MLLYDRNTFKDKTILTSLTSLRFFVALFVVVHHVAAISGNLFLVSWIARLGWLGVSFFYFIRLCSHVVVRREHGFGCLYYPAANSYLSTSLRLPCAALGYFIYTGSALGGYVGNWPGTVAYFLLLQDWLPGHPNIRQAWNGVSWTLSCEFYLYFLAPLSFLIFLRIDRFKYLEFVAFLWLLLIIFTVIAQARNWSAAFDFCIYHPVPRSTDFFLGALGARWVKAGFRFDSVIASLCLMLLPLLIYCVLVPEASECVPLINLLFVPGAFLLIPSTAGADYDGIKSRLQKRFLVEVGEASFALYMTHALLLGIYSRLIARYFKAYFYSSPLREAALTILFLATAVVFSTVVHLALEAPVRKVLVRFLLPAKKNIP